MYRRAAGRVSGSIGGKIRICDNEHHTPMSYNAFKHEHHTMNITHQCNALNTEHHTPMYCNDLYNIILQQSKHLTSEIAYQGQNTTHLAHSLCKS